MENRWIEILCALILMLLACMYATAFEAAPVDPVGNLQQTPDADDGRIVWAEQIEGDWDVYGVDLLDAAVGLITIAADIGTDQMAPAIWNDRVVYQDNFFGDWDVYVADISDANVPVSYLLTPTELYYLNDQTHPAIHGNTAAWQSYVILDDGQGGTIEDWSIFAADITEPNAPAVYAVDDFDQNQQTPDVYRTNVVYQDDFYGDWDILTADIWLKNASQIEENLIVDQVELNQENPAVWGDAIVCQVDIGGGNYDILSVDTSDPAWPQARTIASGPSNQINPDISGHLVVWQDNRSGNWDIYGYNLITRQEFLITTQTASSKIPHPADQKEPAISGSLVVWQDNRDNPANIYYTWLSGDVIAECADPLTGDVDGDCRVTLMDVALLAADWLGCGLVPAGACGA